MPTFRQACRLPGRILETLPPPRVALAQSFGGLGVSQSSRSSGRLRFTELSRQDDLACDHKSGHLELCMQFFGLYHPEDMTVLCDRQGCERVADYLEVDDHGREYRACAMHTASKTHASRLPARELSLGHPFRSRPAA